MKKTKLKKKILLDLEKINQNQNLRLKKEH
jgi:hypothetical protein